MGNFQEYGFLADDDLNFLPALEEKYGSYLDICRTLNKIAQQLQYQLVIHNEDPAELLSAILFSRVLSTYQAAILVCQKGMKQQVKILIRCILEPYFPLAAIAKDKTFAIKLIEAEEVERLRGINKIIKYQKRNNITGEDHDNAKAIAAKAKAKIEEKNLKKITVYDCAKKAELEDWYDTSYSYMSNTLHSSVRSLEEALLMDKEGKKILALKNEPELGELNALFVALSECLMGAITAICAVFEISVPAEVENRKKQLHELQEVMPENEGKTN